MSISKISKLSSLLSKGKKNSKVNKLLEEMPSYMTKQLDESQGTSWLTKAEVKEARKNFKKDVKGSETPNDFLLLAELDDIMLGNVKGKKGEYPLRFLGNEIDKEMFQRKYLKGYDEMFDPARLDKTPTISEVDKLLADMPTYMTRQLSKSEGTSWLTKAEAKEARKNFKKDAENSNDPNDILLLAELDDIMLGNVKGEFQGGLQAYPLRFAGNEIDQEMFQRKYLKGYDEMFDPTRLDKAEGGEVGGDEGEVIDPSDKKVKTGASADYLGVRGDIKDLSSLKGNRPKFNEPSTKNLLSSEDLRASVESGLLAQQESMTPSLLQMDHRTGPRYFANRAVSRLSTLYNNPIMRAARFAASPQLYAAQALGSRFVEGWRNKAAEGGEITPTQSQMGQLMPSQETHTMPDGTEMAGATHEQAMLPDEEMEEDYVDFVVNQALTPEEQEFLNNELESNDTLSMIFDKVVEVASEFSGEGPVDGPGTGISDSIPARLSDGEFVFTADAVKVIGVEKLEDLMEAAEAQIDERITAYDGGYLNHKEDKNQPLSTLESQQTQSKVEEEMIESNPRLRYPVING